MRLPDGYEAVVLDTVRGFARADAAGWLGRVLGDGQTLHEWASRQARSTPLAGRAPVFAVAAPTGEAGGCWAVRHYRRGGLAASLLADRYLRLGEPRPLRELRASVEARARAVRTPAVVAGAIYARPGFYRADLVTELVPGTVTLAHRILDGEDQDLLPSLRATGRLVAALEKARAIHVDLNAHNVLIEAESREPTAHVVDLDRCRLLPPDAPPPPAKMRRRLERSVRKLAQARGRPLDEPYWAALRSGYEGLA